MRTVHKCNFDYRYPFKHSPKHVSHTLHAFNVNIIHLSFMKFSTLNFKIVKKFILQVNICL